MERDLMNVLENREQQAEIPGVQRRMRMAAHIHHLAQENVADVQRMERVDLRVLSAVKIVDIVALNGLIEERKPEGQNEKYNDDEFPAQVSR